MHSIRSLLWIGDGTVLARCGVDRAPNLEVTWVQSVDEAYTLPASAFDVIVLEGQKAAPLKMALRRLRQRPHCPPAILCLCAPAIEELRALAQSGHYEVLCSDPQSKQEETPSLSEELLARIERLIEPHPAKIGRQQVIDATQAVAQPSTARDQPIGSSLPMRGVLDLADRAAGTSATVLIQGETGTGKELIARRIHHRSPRSRHPFVAVNCAAFSETLLESELFGHRKGAFTGADRDKPGLFERAHHGSLFLDEVGETSPALQAKLLRVLQERELLPVGGTRPQSIDVRVIAATNRPLHEEVERKRFRQDLFYRLAVFPILIPPLRERLDDVLPLARHFIRKIGPGEGKAGCRLSQASERLLLTHTWPGNVRELENEIQRALALAEPDEVISPRLLSQRLLGILEAVEEAGVGGETLRESVDRVEAWLIRRALDLNDGRKARTARRLGITREGLYKKMKRLGIE
ncbi:MAG: hypothetical protein CBC48_12450 [bacterium TMED88]|nr:hypothetical protein [Deltaproteobacteria bacterium]OUV28881.1 MAG: hypothetical protein CBC48_12450 [bacterium TMED88]